MHLAAIFCVLFDCSVRAAGNRQQCQGSSCVCHMEYIIMSELLGICQINAVSIRQSPVVNVRSSQTSVINRPNSPSAVGSSTGVKVRRQVASLLSGVRSDRTAAAREALSARSEGSHQLLTGGISRPPSSTATPGHHRSAVIRRAAYLP